MTAQEVLTSIGVSSAALMILAQAVKQVVPDRYMKWLPLATILFGMVAMPLLALAVGQRGSDLVNAMLVGLFGAGSAIGFYKAQSPANILAPKE